MVYRKVNTAPNQRWIKKIVNDNWMIDEYIISSLDNDITRVDEAKINKIIKKQLLIFIL